MNRRDALKNLTAGLGYTIATPTVLSILNSCTAKTESWTPLFLSETEKHIVTHLADIILPTSETPGALDVNVPQFLDLMYHDMETAVNKKLFNTGATFFVKKFNNSFNYETTLKGEKEDFEKLLNSYFTPTDGLSVEDVETLLKEDAEAIITNVDLEAPSNKVETYSIYKFLLSVKYYTLFGYFTSEKVGEEVLAYDPIPGVYNSCISVEEATNGKAWSL
ncbi:gluconate 2-dehydrogenase subunit 3 family protein [Flavivirga aquimarina]|uniref:Gluconate 2-dehydrogenase subunit 3 family protein n=1 Tax=Flavivirga aquimarina TaxID=2027862 RepID=A0ABT8WH78_9FLAO|nr:gluconate 2-dehydrogenase subunit 3 family protein [Flavivirga aquimarina]MDO5972341.1 gluconate 2-dehydrogenase subunit 3 family protein [Flavivirga aquimarina]